MSKKRILWIVTVCLVCPAGDSRPLCQSRRISNQKRELTENLEAERTSSSSSLTRQKDCRKKSGSDRKLQQLREEIAYLEGEIEKRGRNRRCRTGTVAAEEALARQEGLLSAARHVYSSGCGYISRSAAQIQDLCRLTRLNNLKTIAVNDLKLLEEIEAERDRIRR